jgi:hypothetical protein
MGILLKTMRVLLFALLLALNLNSFSQDFKFGIQSGYGTYSMSGLKDFNSYIIKNLPFEAKEIESYPGYIYYQPSIIGTLNDISVGLFYSYHSTGSRVSSKDYSGEYRLDTRIKASAIGLSFHRNFRFAEMPMLYIAPYLKLGYLYTKMPLNEYLTIYDETVNDLTIHFWCENYLFEPGVKFGREFGIIDINLTVGYQFQFGDGYLRGPSKSYLQTDNEKKISPNWNGIRAGVSVVFRFYSI